MPTRSDIAQSTEARARADASFKKAERAKDGAKAMMEYLANAHMVRERTERLRALRLAKEASAKSEEASEKSEKKGNARAAVGGKATSGKRVGAKV